MHRDHLDLFSGIGGFALAAQWCGLRTVGFCECEPYARQILKEKFGAVADSGCKQSSGRNEAQEGLQHPGWRETRRESSPCGDVARLHHDIRTLDGTLYRGVWLLTGGFPCQPYSVAGKRGGSGDYRALWPEMLRVISEARPTWVLGENVAGIITMELDRVLSDLEGIGYACRPFVVPACAVDAKHRRDRVWIVAHSNGGEHQRSGAQSNQRQIPGGYVEEDGAVANTSDGGIRCRGAQRQAGQPALSGEALADANQPGPQGRNGGELCERGAEWTPWPGCSPVSDANSESQNWPAIARGQCCEWLPEPELGRVAHGIPHRSHRLRGLGNAIVPQVAAEFIRAMILADQQFHIPEAATPGEKAA